MNRRDLLRLAMPAAMAALLAACSTSSSPDSTAASDGEQAQAQEQKLPDDMHPGARALIEAYPDFISGYDDNAILFNDGTKMTFDDGKEKDFATMLDNSDVEDMFYKPYKSDGRPEYLADAGRSRCEALFKKMYGDSEGSVRSKLVDVAWQGSKVRFTPVNGAADSLAAVNRELSSLPHLRKYLDSSGTFYWRNVRGANRLSAHSYGIAFDIAVPFSNYWLWDYKGAGETDKIGYSNKIPAEIVEIFEKHGFIWGGAWYHYDTMHFEFRPEILAYARLKNSKTDSL